MLEGGIKMKGVVLEKKNNMYTILTEEGDYVKKRYGGSYSVGEEIDVKIQPKINYKSFAAAAAVLVLIGILALNTFIIPYGYAEVAINPSVELGYNRLYNIVKSEGLNEDGKILMQNAKKIKGMKLEDAVSYLIDEADRGGYIKENEENYLVLAYTGRNSKEDLELEDKIKEKTDNSGIETMFMNVEKNQYEEMRKNMENPAVEGLKEKLKERNVPEEEYEDVNEVKDLARMLNNKEKEQHEEGRPENIKPDKETGPPEHADPQGEGKDNDDNKDSEGNEDKDKGNSKNPGKGNKGGGGNN
jgi:hypothetical protein